MRAVIIATGEKEAVQGIKLRQVTPLLPCVDRPILQHVIEVLVEQGVTEFEFVLHEAPEEIEAFLGDGKRWGSHFTFQLARNAEHPYRILKLLNHSGPLVLAHADCLPNLARGELVSAKPGSSVLFCSTDGAPENTAAWTGWALLDREIVSSLPMDLDRARLEAFLVDKLGAEGVRLVSESLELGTLKGILEAQRSFLSNRFTGLHLAARQADPEVWIARNVVIHPTAKLVAPLFIGENSRVGAGARIGPNAVIGHDTVVDRHTSVQDAALLPGSYCGEGLELDQVFVDRNRLINVSLSTEVHISDSFIHGTMKGSNKRGWAAQLSSRCAASVLFILTFPLLALVWLIRRNSLFEREAVILPAGQEDKTWSTFPLYTFRNGDEKTDGKGWRFLLFDILPNLSQIARGRIQFVGVQPRSPQEIDGLPEDWRALYLQSRAGLITEAGVLHGSTATEDEVYSSEVYYSAMASTRHDLGLALRFLARTVHLA